MNEEISTNNIENPRINFHINYDESISMKDFIEILDLIRLATNETLFENFRISKQNSNNILKINKIIPGSIEFETVLCVAANIATISTFAILIVEKIKSRIESIKKKSTSNSYTNNKPVYSKYPTTLSINNNIINNSTIVINVGNKDELQEIIKLNLRDKK